MKSNSMTVRIARVAMDIEREHGGTVTKEDLTTLLREHGINQEEELYRNKMVKWHWLFFDPRKDTYTLSEAAMQTGTITITVPRLNAKEVRRHLVEKLAGYDRVLQVGEVEL